MLLFCPTCGNLLLVEESANCLRFSCGTCPYISNITKVVRSRNYPKLKVNFVRNYNQNIHSVCYL